MANGYWHISPRILEYDAANVYRLKTPHMFVKIESNPEREMIYFDPVSKVLLFNCDNIKTVLDGNTGEYYLKSCCMASFTGSANNRTDTFIYRGNGVCSVSGTEIPVTIDIGLRIKFENRFTTAGYYMAEIEKISFEANTDHSTNN